MKTMLLLILSVLASRHNALHVVDSAPTVAHNPVVSYEVGMVLTHLKNSQLERFQVDAEKAKNMQREECHCLFADPIYGTCTERKKLFGK